MTDYDNDEYEYQNFKQTMDEQTKHFQRYQQEQAQQYSNKVFNDLWNETLKEEGLDPQTYGNLAAQDPEHVKASLKNSMKNLIGNVKKGRDSQGRFTKQQGQPQRVDSHAKLDELKEKVNKGGRITSSDEDAILEALFPDPLWKG